MWVYKSLITIKDRIIAVESNISSINRLGDVTIYNIQTKNILVYDGSQWANKSIKSLTDNSVELSINEGKVL